MNFNRRAFGRERWRPSSLCLDPAIYRVKSIVGFCCLDVWVASTDCTVAVDTESRHCKHRGCVWSHKLSRQVRHPWCWRRRRRRRRRRRGRRRMVMPPTADKARECVWGPRVVYNAVAVVRKGTSVWRGPSPPSNPRVMVRVYRSFITGL